MRCAKPPIARAQAGSARAEGLLDHRLQRQRATLGDTGVEGIAGRGDNQRAVYLSLHLPLTMGTAAVGLRLEPAPNPAGPAGESGFGSVASEDGEPVHRC